MTGVHNSTKRVSCMVANNRVGILWHSCELKALSCLLSFCVQLLYSMLTCHSAVRMLGGCQVVAAHVIAADVTLAMLCS